MIGVNNMLVVPTAMDADIVEKVVASIFDNLDEFRAENSNARQIDPANSLNLAFPLHPGATRYFNK